MNRRFGRLPPLTALEGFEAAARLKSFSLAAEELSITQSAVSHQIRALEDFFEMPLFNRVGRSVELTVAGIDFLGTATLLLDQLARGKRRMDFYSRPGSVVWGSSAAFASKWLLPRYGKLREWFPDIQPWLYTSDETYELQTQEVDLAIWYGDGNWEGVTASKLFHDHLTPLYAPSLFPKNKKLREYSDLGDHTLIHNELRDDWLDWFRQVDHRELDSVKGCNFSDAGLMLDCAAYGQGVALGSLLLGADLIDKGQLKQPYKDVLVTQDAYYLVEPANIELRPAVATAKEWILQEAQQFIEGLGLEDKAEEL